MHIHSSGQPWGWTGVSGNYTQKQATSRSADPIDTAASEAAAKNAFTDALNSAIAPIGTKQPAFDAALAEQLHLVEIEPASSTNTSSVQKTNQRPRDLDETDSTAQANPTSSSSTFSTRGNLVNIFA